MIKKGFIVNPKEVIGIIYENESQNKIIVMLTNKITIEKTEIHPWAGQILSLQDMIDIKKMLHDLIW